MSYALIEFASADSLGTEGHPLLPEDKKDRGRIKFVCDKQDLEYMIMRSQQIKERS